MHDGESVSITERCNESEPVAQGGDKMIHPVGFASTRIIDLILCECKKASCEATPQLASDGRGRRNRTLGTRIWSPLLYQLSYTPSDLIIIPQKRAFVKRKIKVFLLHRNNRICVDFRIRISCTAEQAKSKGADSAAQMPLRALKISAEYGIIKKAYHL